MSATAILKWVNSVCCCAASGTKRGSGSDCFTGKYTLLINALLHVERGCGAGRLGERVCVCVCIIVVVVWGGSCDLQQE